MGLPKDVALRALTVEPARLFGVEGQLGTLEVGRVANVTALTGELGAAATRVRHVIADGRKFEFEARARDQGPPAAGLNLTGTWSVTIDSPMGSREATMTLRQEGGKVTGTLKSEMGEMTVGDGSLSGRTLLLPLKLNFGDRSINLDLEGEVSADGNTVGGSASGPFGNFDWKATRPGGPR
jgi:hypothetical protein